MGVWVWGALAVPYVSWPLGEGGLRFLADLGGWGSGSGKLSANGSRLWEGAWEAEILLLLALKLPEMR